MRTSRAVRRCVLGALALVAIGCASQTKAPPPAPVARPTTPPPATAARPPKHVETLPGQLDGNFEVRLLDGCVFASTIEGELEAGGVTGHVIPHIHVEATVRCPDGAPASVTEDVTASGPVSAAELEHLLERTSTVETDASGRPCVYLPDLSLDAEGVHAIAVGFECALAASEAD